jgi:putative heme degradation protein
MRDHATRSVRELIVTLHAVEAELRAARCTADLDRLTGLIRTKRSMLRELRRRRLPRSSAA